MNLSNNYGYKLFLFKQILLITLPIYNEEKPHRAHDVVSLMSRKVTIKKQQCELIMKSEISKTRETIIRIGTSVLLDK
jgi:hypothetical protein